MARPRKETVDYFPHDCKHGKTMFILEQRYGNDGYAFWFKLLEILGSTNGHFLKIESDADTEFLAAVTKITAEQCIEILDLLAKLGAINAELWAQKYVWSDNFVDRLSDVYRKRESETPLPPVETPVSGVENPQSKLKEIILLKEDQGNDYSDTLELKTGELKSVSSIWDDVLESIRGKILPSLFQMYLEDTYSLGISNNTFNIAVNTEFKAEQIKKRIERHIEQSIEDVTGLNMKLYCKVQG